VPTYDRWPGFVREYLRLTLVQRAQFMDAVDDMVEDLKARRPFRPDLRVYQVQKVAGVWEMTWAPNGRATFMYGAGPDPGEQHIIWRHICKSVHSVGEICIILRVVFLPVRCFPLALEVRTSPKEGFSSHKEAFAFAHSKTFRGMASERNCMGCSFFLSFALNTSPQATGKTPYSPYEGVVFYKAVGRYLTFA